MLHIALYEPEIPANTGNIIRLCANTGAQLHLIEPLGFELDDKKLRRAGLDYHEWVNIKRYPHFPAFIATLHSEQRLFALTTKGKAAYNAVVFQDQDVLLFGPETRGLPGGLLQTLTPAHQLYLPMCPDSRSLNLSNTVAIVLYAAWQDIEFQGALLKA
ncbi:MAG: tRNA (uridine(34)/cytosine(34)/5-carboxymethylaminomethyluridine(34)-2'-O)-methyltransferase TrmL [Methylococcaceae bacterium]|nr:tRNA (uridine(34)/cytosine(34)/5-carboxymethylaminomethyluridine(34)-2'-O)-methyltransferase TrmL [Methylococcaceae bacterium]